MVEEFLSFHELFDVDEFVDKVEVDVDSVSCFQVVGADYHVAVYFADAHVSSSSHEFNPEVCQYFFCVFVEGSFDCVNVFEPFEVVEKWVGCDGDVSGYVDV